MAKQRGLHISTDLTLPLNAVTSTIVVYGGKGMGKTNLGGVVIEELTKAGLKWAVLDPMGVWWGIRHSVDGNDDGVQCLILGGPHGDIPIEPTGGAVVADLVADETANVVIDVSRRANGEMWSIAERIRFVNDYGKQLFRRQGSLVNGRRREPMMQLIDEAARFIPQIIRSGQPELAMCTSTWSTIVEEGRNVGLGVMLLTQRSARLNKDVAELADAMIAFRTIGPNSLEAVTDWLSAEVSKQELKVLADQVRSLPVGSCLIVSPGWLKQEKVVAIRMRETFDSSATPKPGEQAKRVRGAGAKPDLAKYAERMKETIERAKEDSVPDLKRRIRELEAAAAKTPVAKVNYTPAAVEQTRQRLIETEKQRDEANRRIADVRRKAEKLHTFVDNQVWPMLEKLKGALVDIDTSLGVIRSATDVTLPVQPDRPVVQARKPAPERTVKIAHVESENAAGTKLSGMGLKIASVAAGYGARGEGIDKKLLCALLGMKSGGTLSGRLNEAKSAGAIRIEGQTVWATSEGVAQYSGMFKAPETTEEVVALWSEKLSGKAKEMFDYLVSLGGEAVTRTKLAEAIGVSSGGTFSGRLSEVRSTGLLVENGSNIAVNRELLFM